MKELYKNVTPLAGAGSNRSYCRFEMDGRSYVGTVGTDVKENAAFIALSKHFRAKGLPVPEVFEVSPDGLMYVQEDLGNELLADRVAAAHKAGGIEPGSQLADLLCRTVALLPKFQMDGARGLDFPYAIRSRRLTAGWSCSI